MSSGIEDHILGQ